MTFLLITLYKLTFININIILIFSHGKLHRPSCWQTVLFQKNILKLMM